jgi:hypothetical protein
VKDKWISERVQIILLKVVEAHIVKDIAKSVRPEWFNDDMCAARDRGIKKALAVARYQVSASTAVKQSFK